MYKSHPFHNWVPGWLTTVFAITMVMVQNTISSISSYSIGEITSGLGQESELIKIAFYSASIGLVAMFPVYYRLRQLLQRKRMLLIALIIELALCIVVPLLREGWEFIIVSFFIGVTKCVCLVDAIGMLMIKLNPKNSRGLFYGIYYPISFAAGQVIGYISAYLVVDYEWSFIYHLAVPGILVSIALVLFFMHDFRSQRKVPFYQFDWSGLGLFLVFSFSLTAVCIYGERLNWFESEKIQMGTLLTIISFLLFIVRELTAKRPYLDLSTLKRFPQVSIGVLLMLVMYIGYNSGSIMSVYMESVLKYDHIYVAETSTYMIIPFITVIPFVGWMLSKHYPVRIFLFAGFMLFAFYHFAASRLFYVEQNITYLILLQILKGAAYGICITALSYYASQHVSREYNGHRAFFSVGVRYAIATPVTSAIFGHWLTVHQKLHYTSLSANFIAQNTTLTNNVQMLSSASGASSGLSMASVARRLEIQSLLLSSVDIYTIIAIVCLFIAFAILFIKYLDIHYTKHYKSYPLVEL